MVVEYKTGLANGIRIGNRLNFQFKNKLTVFADASYQFKSTQRYINIGINWRLPFMQLNGGSYSTPKNTNVYTQVNGALLFQGGHTECSGITSASASLKVVLFVDVNNNGIRDNEY